MADRKRTLPSGGKKRKAASEDDTDKDESSKIDTSASEEGTSENQNEGNIPLIVSYEPLTPLSSPPEIIIEPLDKPAITITRASTPSSVSTAVSSSSSIGTSPGSEANASSDSSDLAATPEGGAYRVQGFLNSPVSVSVKRHAYCCTLDSFLVSIKLAMSRTRYDFTDNFVSKSGKGLELENALRKMSDHFVLRDRQTGQRIPDFDIVEESAVIQNIWIEFIQVDSYYLTGTEETRVFSHTGEVSSFQHVTRCSKGQITSQRDFSTAWFQNMAEFYQLVTSQRLISGRPKAACSHPDCLRDQDTFQILVKPTTWMFVVVNYGKHPKVSEDDFYDIYPENLWLDQKNEDGSIQRAFFKKAYTSYTRYDSRATVSHLVSIQHIKEELYFFDDLNPMGALTLSKTVTPVSTRSEQKFVLSAIVFYRRPANRRTKSSPLPASVFRSPNKPRL